MEIKDTSCLQAYFPKHCWGNNGFTMVELIIAIAIISILTAVAVPNFLKFRPNMYLKGVARELYSRVQNTRMRAIKGNRSHAIVFDTGANSYSIFSSPGADNNWASTNDNVLEATFALSEPGSGIAFGHGDATAVAGSSGGTFPGDGVGFSNNILIFNSRGLADSSGYIYIENEQDTAFAIGALISGVIRFKQWGNGDWK